MHRSKIINAIGWIGAIAFAISALPQAIASYRSGTSAGINGAFLALWFLGEVCMLTYVIPKKDAPLIMNYVFNLACLFVIIYFWLWPV